MKINLPRLEDISFKKKLILIQLFIYIPILIVCSLTFLIIDIRQYKKDKENALLSISHIIGSNSASAILNKDTAAAGKTLNALSSENDITDGCLIDNLGKILVVYNKPGTDSYKFSVLKAKGKTSEYEEGHLIIYDKISLNDKNVGYVCMRAKLSQLNVGIVKKIEIGLLVLFLSILISIIITPRLQKYFSLPLYKLVGIMQDINTTGNYDKRSDLDGKDEIGQLSKSFNEMLDKIQNREYTIQETIQKLNSILDSIGDGIIVSDKDGKIIHTNSASIYITGITHQEDLSKDEWQTKFGIYHPDTKEPLETKELPLVKAINGEELNNTEVLLKNSHKKEGVYLNVTSRPVLDKADKVIGGVAVFRDITEKKKEEDRNKGRINKMFQFQESILKLTAMDLEIPLKLKLKKIIELSARYIDVERVGIWMYNNERTAITSENIYINSKNEYIPGMTIAARDYPRYFLALEVSTIDANDAMHDTRTFEFRDDYLKPNNITSLLDIPIRIGGRLSGVLSYEQVGPQRKWTHEEQIYASSIAGIVAMVIENHERVKSEQELQKLNTELIKSKDFAERSNKSKNRFLANISHKIRNTPLNAIVGFLQLLKETKLNKEQEDILYSMELASRYLLVIINDILDLSEIESGTLTFAKNEINIKKITSDAVTLVKEYAQEKNLDLTIHHDNALPDVLLGDAERLSQIITNLISNAIKFTEKGKISVHTRIKRETEEEIVCEFSVKDTGIGMKEEKRAQFFEPFSKDFSGSILKHGETGFGLAMSRILIEMQDGKITIKSERGVGTEIQFYLPFRKSKKYTPKELQKYEGPEVYEKSLNILLAEDMELNQNLVSRIISKTEHHLDIASNGKEAVEKVKTHDYDLILMDIQMPELDGCQATRIIRNLNDENKSKIPIIALTAYVSGEEGKTYLKLGMNAHIKKPFNKKDLLTIIDKLTHKNVKKMPPKEKAKSELKQYDLSYLEETADGDNEFLSDMIQLFMDNSKTRFKELASAIEEKNYKDITLIVHKIKNLVLPFQMNKEIELTQSIEEDSRAKGDMNTITAKIDDLKARVFNVVQDLEKELDRLNNS